MSIYILMVMQRVLLLLLVIHSITPLSTKDSHSVHTAPMLMLGMSYVQMR